MRQFDPLKTVVILLQKVYNTVFGGAHMKKLQSILVAVDFSEASRDAVRYAVTLAEKFNSEIFVLTVIPEIEGSPLGFDTIKAEISKLLQEMKDDIGKKGHVPVETILAQGTAYDQITKHAMEKDVNVVIIGAGDKQDTDKYQLGTTAYKVVRTCPKPVWVTKKGCSQDIRHILCPVDFSDAAGRALKNAMVLAGAFGAKLTVLNVIERLSNIYPGRPLLEPDSQGSYAKEQDNAFTSFLNRFNFQGVQWEKLARIGDPGDEILKAAQETNAEVVIMGSEGRTGLSRIIMGSVAEKVIREVPCSMITVKAEASIV